MNTNDYATTKALLEQKMAEWLANKRHCAVGEINLVVPFIDYDLDSITSAELLSMLEGYMERELELHLTKDYKTINDLAAHLAQLKTSDAIHTAQPAKSYDKYLSKKNSKI